MKNHFKKLLFTVLFFGWLCSVNSAIYVAANGNDSDAGTYDKPFLTISKAISVAVAGDTIFVRGGNYSLVSTISISASKSGTLTEPFCLFAYPGEKPVLDFSDQALGAKGISLKADYWQIKGLNVFGAGDNGMDINGGSFNTIEGCAFYENRDTGLQLGKGASFNRIINCDSYFNADPPDYGDADGFAPKLDVGTGNYFYGCRSWRNCDDGWDGYLRGTTDVTTTLEKCWTWGNGYLKDGTDPGSRANGNGFKMGGGDTSNINNLMHHFILKNCLSFANKAKGFDQNNNAGSMILYNCSAYDNKTANYRIQKQPDSGQVLILKNCLSFKGSVELGTFAIQETNSWLTPFLVTADDFLSVDYSDASDTRSINDSLPRIDFMHLAPGSDLIDAGAVVGINYLGSAPDLGAFESNFSATALSHKNYNPESPILFGNFPNPFNPLTKIVYSIPQKDHITIDVFDIVGRKIMSLVHEEKAAGIHSAVFDGSGFCSGTYIYRLKTEGQVFSGKIVLVK